MCSGREKQASMATPIGYVTLVASAQAQAALGKPKLRKECTMRGRVWYASQRLGKEDLLDVADLDFQAFYDGVSIKKVLPIMLVDTKLFRALALHIHFNSSRVSRGSAGIVPPTGVFLVGGSHVIQSNLGLVGSMLYAPTKTISITEWTPDAIQDAASRFAPYDLQGATVILWLYDEMAFESQKFGDPLTRSAYDGRLHCQGPMGVMDWRGMASLLDESRRCWTPVLRPAVSLSWHPCPSTWASHAARSLTIASGTSMRSSRSGSVVGQLSCTRQWLGG